MKADDVNVFVQAATSVFEQELGVQLKRQSITRKELPIPGRPICIVLGITGALRGQVVYALDEQFAMDIARALLPNKLPSEQRKLMKSAVGEIGNIVTGQATIKLAGSDRRLDLTPPTVVTGKELALDFLSIPTVSLQMLSTMGALEINVALQETNGAEGGS